MYLNIYSCQQASKGGTPFLLRLAEQAGLVATYLCRPFRREEKFFYIKDGALRQRKKILADWQSLLFLREEKKLNAKGWLIDVMNCIDQLGKADFDLADVYAFADLLRKKYPNNRHIKDKIRQQLQVLRDKGYLEFIGGGNYRLTGGGI